ncbi:hypothetical protein [Streptomyces sp. NPDC055692]|uniref:hypothetical protein n=1 Tax=Streptomyces sp. NPDC055692 TaxID=3155683 RepID=UPI003439B1EE
MTKRLDKACRTMPVNVIDAIRSELTNGVTVSQLAARIERRWPKRRFEDDALSADGRGIDNLFAVAYELVEHGDCPHPLCDDGTDLATGEDCRTCERTREDRQPAAPEYTQGAFAMALPGGDEPPASAPEPVPNPREQLRTCGGTCERAIKTVPAPAPPGLCRDCRRNLQEAKNA